MEHTPVIGTNIRRERLRRGMSATELAGRAGVSESAIRKVEAGTSKQPSFEVGVRIAEALGVTPQSLLPEAKKPAVPHGTLPKVLRALREQRAALEKLGVVSASVFGSVARGDDTASSDVDVLIDVAPARFSLLDLSRVAVHLENALGRHVDVEARSSLKKQQSPLLEAIERDAVNAF